MQLQLRLYLVSALMTFVATAADGKSPGATYCFNAVCHRVLTLDETRAIRGIEMKQVASFYDACEIDRENPCTRTSSGKAFIAALADNVASPIFPNGTVLLLWNASNGRRARVLVNNSGPYVAGRLLDVSRATAELLDFVGFGIAQLRVTVIEVPGDDAGR
jgi:rare lipoprotein A